MQTLLKETVSIIIENENTLILQSKDTFMSVDMQFPSKLHTTVVSKKIYLFDCLNIIYLIQLKFCILK